MNGPQDETNRTLPDAPGPGAQGHPGTVASATGPVPPQAGSGPASVARDGTSSRWGSVDRKSPGLACFLSCMPGLGQIYVGYYRRGFAHAIIVASLITLLNMELDDLTPLLALFLAFFWLYNIIDAGRRAVYYNHVVAGGETLDMPADFEMPGIGGSIIGGLLLIGAGLIFLTHTVWGFSLAWLEDWWPAALILLGAYLVGKAIFDRATQQEEGKRT